MMLTVSVLVIMAIIVAMTWSEGLWSNLLSFVNALLAAIIATNTYEFATKLIEGQAPELTYFWDFIMFWMLFGFVFGILRALTDQISPTRVRFKLPVEATGRAVFGFLTAWVVVCIFLFSLHMAPLDRTCYGGAFGKAPDGSNFFLDPDRLWLGFMQSRSKGAFATSGPNVFDPKSEFILKYGERRKRFSEMSTLTIDTRGRRRR